jgi:UDP-N-acetylglucosamine 2-epimerase
MPYSERALKVIYMVGARPNFIKVAPVVDAMRQLPTEFTPLVVHADQHYNARCPTPSCATLDILYLML